MQKTKNKSFSAVSSVLQYDDCQVIRRKSSSSSNNIPGSMSDHYRYLCQLSVALTVNPHIHYMKRLKNSNTDIAAVGH